ncbi:response regulator transcription factor [uncultured Pseudokineococcus sp.]|uniref:response regulator transcription factor n=1 Tax=uncultured Pseudokineococcus sp. TaxID=1642928 RepID=UPI002625B24E|nr:response regulator transcription factor [uncultured Pseudokineococcus sp.]
MIRVLLVDDQAVVRAGFRVLLEEAGDVEVVAEASSGAQAVAAARATRPDVVCMDVRMPGGDGLTATRRIVGEPVPSGDRSPGDDGDRGHDEGSDGAAHRPAVLVVTTFDLDEYVFGALEAGASGFLLKDCEPEELVGAVRRLAAGDGLVDSAVTRRVIREFARRTPSPAPAAAQAQLLTARERDVVELLARGLTNAEIAAELVVEVSTVKSHLGRAMTKLGTQDRLQTVVWAFRSGLARPS